MSVFKAKSLQLGLSRPVSCLRLEKGESQKSYLKTVGRQDCSGEGFKELLHHLSGVREFQLHLGCVVLQAHL